MTSNPSPALTDSPAPAALFVRDTVQWLERAVIGLNLCPFAKSVHVKGQIHYALTLTDDPQEILHLLKRELSALVASPPETRDTTLLILPCCLNDFLDFNEFVGRAEKLLGEMGLEGILQIASFHPQFQFAGTEADDVTNCTNRSPYPTLHLLREESIDRAVDAFPDPELIYERNMQVLCELGVEGWTALQVGASVSAPPPTDDVGAERA